MIAAIATTITLDMNTIILAVISLAGTCVTGFLALRMATVAADQKEQKEAQADVVDNLKEIHVAVNSAKTVLENKVDDLIKQNVELAKKVATLEEGKRGAELAKALAAVPANLVAMPIIPVVPAMPHSKPVAGALDHAIGELTEAAKDTVEAANETVTLADKVPRTP